MVGSKHNESDGGEPESYSTGLAYRCVCGNLLEISQSDKTACSQCDRSYSSEWLANEGGEETVLATHADGQRRVVSTRGETDPLLDQRWGHFRIIEALGHGGMGTVYRALDESLQRYVALKVIQGSGSEENDTKHVQQLFQEARAQARVNHPNVVHIYFIDQFQGSPFFAMELVNGATLKERLESGPLPFGEAVRIGLQIARALQHALKFDTVHGDIKPSNILLSDTNEIKISDFGLARRLSEAGGDGTLAGTPNYLSPESAARKSTDFRSDLYSLGVTLFELTFGKLPYSYQTASVEERLEAHQFRSVEFPKSWPDSIPTMWRDVLDRLLAKRRENRYQSYDELIQDLETARPASRPSAGILPRGLAWLVDLFLLFIIVFVVFLPVKLGHLVAILGDQPLLEWVIQIGTFVGAPILAIGYQWIRGSTPGKTLFHLRVVDIHGVHPSRTQIVSRTGMQFLVLWTISIFGTLNELGVDVNDLFVTLAIVVPLLVEAGFMVFTKKRLALHDKLFRTRVVLDAGKAEED